MKIVIDDFELYAKARQIMAEAKRDNNLDLPLIIELKSACFEYEKSSGFSFQDFGKEEDD